MSRTDDRADKTLPVTSEVGSEGGSFADPTHQVATFTGDIPRVDGAVTDSTEPVSDTTTDMVRHPTEEPPSKK